MRFTMRFGIALTACVLSTIAFAAPSQDPLEQPITFDQPAQTVRQLLETLSRQTGVRLFAPSPIDSEFVLVAVKEMPLKELMAHLAQVVDGEWLPQPDGSYRLARTPRIIKQRQQEDNEQILKKLKEMLGDKELADLAQPLTEAQARQHRDKLKQLMQEAETSADSADRFWNISARRNFDEHAHALDAGRRLTLRLIRQIDPRRLLEIPVGERRVFSNMRGRYLLPFGFSVQPLVEQYMREKRLVYELWTHPTEGLDEKRVKEFNDRFSYLVPDFQLRQELPAQPLTRVYLKVDRTAPDSFYFSTELLTDDLKEMVYAGFVGSYELEYRHLVEQQASRAQTQQSAEAKVEWSEPSRQFIEAYRAMERATEPTPLPPILDPAQTEPLSLIPSDVLRAYARHKNKNLVAHVPDSLCVWIRIALVRAELSRFTSWLEWSYQQQETERVILIKLRWSSYEWGARVDRKALSELLNNILKQGYIRLEHSLALLKLCEPVQHDYWLLDSYLDMLQGDSFIVSDFVQANLRLLRSLTPAQLQHLQSGGTLAINALTPYQREQLIKDIYYSDSTLERDYRWVAEQTLASGQLVRLSDLPATELVHAVYPDGLPPNAVLKTADKEEEMGVFTRRKAGVWSDFREAMDLAMAMFVFTDEKRFTANEWVRQYYQQRIERYKNSPLMPAVRKSFALVVQMAPFVIELPSSGSYYGGARLADYRLLNDGKPVTFDQLPPELKKKIEEYQQMYRSIPEE